MYLLTRDGFTLLAMGFNGRRAMIWKVKYLQAFNKMENKLREGEVNLRQLLADMARCNYLSPKFSRHLALRSVGISLHDLPRMLKIRRDPACRVDRVLRTLGVVDLQVSLALPDLTEVFKGVSS